MAHSFIPTRPDGRSDRQVIFDLAHDAEPETVFTLDELVGALQDGIEKPVKRARVYSAIAAANKRLMREEKRYLQVVRTVGYKVLRADEHLSVALAKKETAQGHLKRGIELLRNARLDELTEAQRTLHQGQLLVLSGFHSAIRESERRHDRHDKAIDELRRRIQRVEGDRGEDPAA